VHFGTDCASQVIVGVDTVTAGSDMAQLAPMVAQVEQRLGSAPEQWLVDGGCPAHTQIDAVAGKTELYAPVPQPKPPKAEAGDEPPGQPPVPGSEFEPKPGDSAAVAQWRTRMNSDAAREIYKDRAAKVRCVVRLYALAHNLMRMAALAPQLIGWGIAACAATANPA
jgi:hypothetical protein